MASSPPPASPPPADFSSTRTDSSRSLEDTSSRALLPSSSTPAPLPASSSSSSRWSFRKLKESGRLDLLLLSSALFSIILVILIPKLAVENKLPPHTSVLLVGDSQCYEMMSTFYEEVHHQMQANLQLRGLLRQGGVRLNIDCRSFRRMAVCLPEQRHCTTGTGVMQDNCVRKGRDYDVVISFLGVNNIDWVSPMYKEIYNTQNMTLIQETRKAETMVEVEMLVNATQTYCPTADKVIAGPLDIVKCGWERREISIGDTCRKIDGTYMGPHYRSQWLQDLFEKATIAQFGASSASNALYVNTSLVGDPETYKDATHTVDLEYSRRLARKLGKAVGLQTHIRTLEANGMSSAAAIAAATSLYTDAEQDLFMRRTDKEMLPEGYVSSTDDKSVSAFKEMHSTCSNNTGTNETLHEISATDEGPDGDLACKHMKIWEFWVILLIFLTFWILYECVAVISLGDTAPHVEDAMPKLMPALEGIRVIGAIHIMLFHLYQRFDWIDYYEETCSFCGFGKYWVQVFFLITGRVSYRSCSRDEGPDGFLLARKRVVVLYPLYFIACLMGYAVSIFNQDAATADATMRSLLLNQTWYPPFHFGSVNGPGWFLSCLFVFWIALPHWARACKRASTPRLVLLLCIPYLASWSGHLTCYSIFDFPLTGRWYQIQVHNMIEFSPYANWYNVALGVGLASLSERWPKENVVKRLVQRFGASASLLGIFIFFLVGRSPGFDMGRNELLVDKGPLSLPVLTVLMLACTDSANSDPTAKVLAIIGRAASLAWPIYILHMPIAALLKEILDEEDYPVWFNVVIQPLVLILGSWLGARFHTAWNAHFNNNKKNAGRKGSDGRSAKNSNKGNSDEALGQEPQKFVINVSEVELTNSSSPDKYESDRKGAECTAEIA